MLQKFIDTIDGIDDVNLENIADCISWSDKVKNVCADGLSQIANIIKEKKNELIAAKKDNNKQSTNRLYSEIRALEYLIEVPECIAPDNYLVSLITRQTLIINGQAGSGKSQLCAVAAERLISTGLPAILLLGTNFLNNNPIYTQTIEILELNLSFDALLHKL